MRRVVGCKQEHQILFEPVDIGPKVLRNRFYQVPQCTGFGTDKPLAQAAHRAMKAEGGWAAVCTEYAPIGPDTDQRPAVAAHIWDEQDACRLALMCQAVHEHGALAGIELHHGGTYGQSRESRHPLLAPSQVAVGGTPRGLTPKEMELADIERVQQEWIAAARRARDIGFDIVYVYGAHSYLLAQFLSPQMNRRSDKYGGSLVNRARMWLETLEGVRAAIGADCAIAARLAVDALGPEGPDLQEGIEFVRLADHLVDLWDIVAGASAGLARIDSGSSRYFPEGYGLQWSAHVRSVTNKPVIGVGRLTNPDTMATAVRDRKLDIIGAARPSIADPFLPKKIEDGRYDEIRECIGCNYCYSRAVYSLNIGCTQNAAAGEEYRRGWHPEHFGRTSQADRSVLVVGAGAAGMECAMVLAKRGFCRVHLVEQHNEIGGTARWISELPGLGEWRRLVEWRDRQLGRLDNAEIITGTRVELSDILNYGVDIVITATGSRWASDGFSSTTYEPVRGVDVFPESVFTPEQIVVERRRPSGHRVLVYDCDGYLIAASLAELLATEGYQVEFVTPYDQVAPVSDEMLEGPFQRRRLHELGVRVHRNTTVRQYAGCHAICVDEYGEPVEVPGESIVLVTQRWSNDRLYLDLIADRARLDAAGIAAVYRAGDCVSPRLLGDAVFDGHRLAREIDSSVPGHPAAYRRERTSV